MNDSSQSEIEALTIPGFHDVMETFIQKHWGDGGIQKILDVGAGQGAFTKRLKERGCEVSACDLHQDQFRLKNVEFKPADISRHIPWPDETFNLVIGLEVVEHLDGASTFFQEAHRVLKPGGFFLISTPNILSIKSRLQYLFSGFFYAFKPLPDSCGDAVIDHITPLPLDLYLYRLRRGGFSIAEITTDKWQRSSMLGMLLYPCIQFYTAVKYGRNSSALQQNSFTCLLGRKLILLAQKQE
ncbi:MAG: class I SAM-dependent methyltransferase [Candidatus Omnitrophica bacterium]|nr:class I SAM-dependent methyltransferase [Candidatus Omnitrophota bacterium]